MSKLCNLGLKQTPINIKTSKITLSSKNIKIRYFSMNKIVIEKAKNNILIDYDNGSHIEYNRNIYELNKIAFTHRSSHKINGKSYPLEMNLYHSNINNSRDVLIIGIFLKPTSKKKNKSTRFFDKIKKFPKNFGQTVETKTRDWNLTHVIGNIHKFGFFKYNGSLPRKPCTENVKWIILETPSLCSDNFYVNMKTIIGRNAPPEKKLNGRKIYYNKNNNQRKTKTTNNTRCPPEHPNCTIQSTKKKKRHIKKKKNKFYPSPEHRHHYYFTVLKFIIGFTIIGTCLLFIYRSFTNKYFQMV